MVTPPRIPRTPAQKHLRKLAKLTPEERAARKRKLAGERKARWRAKHTAEQKRARKEAEEARCATFEHLMPFVVVEEGDDACWRWEGPWRRVYEYVRPWARCGVWGSMDARMAMFLASGRKLPANCFLGRRCGRDECVAPHHLVIENHALRSAKERVRHEP
jgi:hypothetical protein